MILLVDRSFYYQLSRSIPILLISSKSFMLLTQILVKYGKNVSGMITQETIIFAKAICSKRNSCAFLRSSFETNCLMTFMREDRLLIWDETRLFSWSPLNSTNHMNLVTQPSLFNGVSSANKLNEWFKMQVYIHFSLFLSLFGMISPWISSSVFL